MNIFFELYKIVDNICSVNADYAEYFYGTDQFYYKDGTLIIDAHIYGSKIRVSINNNGFSTIMIDIDDWNIMKSYIIDLIKLQINYFLKFDSLSRLTEDVDFIEKYKKVIRNKKLKNITND